MGRLKMYDYRLEPCRLDISLGSSKKEAFRYPHPLQFLIQRKLQVFVIYCLVWNNPGTTMYIGSTKDPDTRFGSHKRQISGGYHCNKWMQRLWDRGYDYEKIVLEVVDGDRIEMIDREQEWIDAFDCINSKDFANLQEARGGSSVTARKVVAVSKNGGVQYFGSIVEAAKSTGKTESSVGKCCKGKQKTAADFQFFHEEDYSPEKVNQDLLENWESKFRVIKHKSRRGVVLVCRETGTVSHRDSRLSAANYLGSTSGVVSNAINGHPSTHVCRNHVAYDKEEWDESASFFYNPG